MCVILINFRLSPVCYFSCALTRSLSVASHGTSPLKELINSKESKTIAAYQKLDFLGIISAIVYCGPSSNN